MNVFKARPFGGWLVLASAACAPAAGAQTGDGGAASQMAAGPTAQARVSLADGYRLGANDEIEVTIFGQGTPQVIKTRVKNDDTITLPFLGAIKVDNRTARELAAYVIDRLREGGYFVRPVVNVEVTQFVSNGVTVYGEVATPGIYPLERQLTVGMMIARAGGAKPNGADFAIVKRDRDPVEHRILLSDLSGEWSASTPLAANDTLFVPPSPVVYVYGQVNSPGSFPLKSGMTVRQALARAGGPTLAGSTRKITVFRDGKKLTKVDLESALRADDSVFVNERLF